MSNFDFSDAFEEAEKEGFGPSADLPEGTFECTIKAANAGTSKKGDQRIGYLFVANEGQLDDDGDDVSGDSVWHNTYFTAKGRKYAAADAKAMGLTPEMLNADADEAVETVVGQVWRIETVQNGDFLNVRLKKRLDDGESVAKPKPKKAKPAPVEEDEDEAPKAKKKGKGKKAKPAPPPEPDDNDDDDDDWDI